MKLSIIAIKNNEIESHQEQVLISNKRKKKKKNKKLHDIIPWFGNPLAFSVLNWGKCETHTTHIYQFTWHLYNLIWRLQFVYYTFFAFGCRMKLSKSTFSLGSTELSSFSPPYFFPFNVGIHWHLTICKMPEHFNIELKCIFVCVSWAHRVWPASSFSPFLMTNPILFLFVALKLAVSKVKLCCLLPLNLFCNLLNELMNHPYEYNNNNIKLKKEPKVCVWTFKILISVGTRHIRRKYV